MKITELFKSLHGSHLYGLSNVNSDEDYYEVYDFNHKNYRPPTRKQSEQTITQEADITRVSLERFDHFCVRGVPQALEALFAPTECLLHMHAYWPGIVQELKLAVWSNRKEVIDRYCTTAVNFMLEDNFKKNRHAFRLLYNLEEYLWHKQFNPRLTEDVKKDISFRASLPLRRRLDNFYTKLDEFE